MKRFAALPQVLGRGGPPLLLLMALLGGGVEAAPHPSKTAASAPTPGTTPLDGYLEGLNTLKTNFQQVLVDAHGKELDRATGKLTVVRPGKFSWELHPQGSNASGGQIMVADGRNVWFYDRDLDQVTVKPVDDALTATPAMLLSGTVDLRKHFQVTPAGMREGLEWVMVEPKSTQADFNTALFGFDHGALKALKLEDKLGQVATLTFEQAQRNAPVAPSEVTFTPPPGADVIGKPR